MVEKQEVEVIVREAIPDDAAQLLDVLRQIRSESDFLTADETDDVLTVEEEKGHLARIFDSPNNTLLLALINDEIIGTFSIHADSHKRIAHIGDIGISILKKYWSQGIGSILMEEGINWARESGVIRRLELTVQDRNQRAIHVYEKQGFKDEAIMERGAIDADGEFLKVHLMSQMID
jgi:RimJ/RimL family protein N-acetyltransferase